MSAKDREIIILAAGGHAAEVYSYLQEAGMSVLGLIDEFKQPGHWGDSRILGNFDDLQRLLQERDSTPFGYITAVGSNAVRQELVARVGKLPATLSAITLQHPSASRGRGVVVGEGTLLAPGSIVTTRTHIGRHCIVNVKASVSHDCRVGDFVNLNPGVTVCGKVRIGEGAFIGAGATIIDGISIGAWSVIGAGAVVVRDIPDQVTAVGVPARVVKRN
jgi:acetyltransferase EpsM